LKTIDVKKITETVRNLCMQANYCIDPEVSEKIYQARQSEESETGREILDIILENHSLAAIEKMPLCQDTGVAIFFLEIGQEIRFVNGNLTEAINEGVRQGYSEGYLRKSMVDDPVFQRINTGDNTPALIYTDIVEGDTLKITFTPKGGGAENMSRIKMMKPADGFEAIEQFVLESVKLAGGNPCPPIILGIGIGGSFEQSALLAKKALLVPLSQPNPDKIWREKEQILLDKINQLKIGPMGLGGTTTALAVKILTKPCHIASMPVALNFQCHCHRHQSSIIE
jgi:fumarate hydratase subunit alpha